MAIQNLGFCPRYVPLTSPVDTTSTTVSSDVVSTQNAAAIDLLVYFGTITGDTVVVTVKECDDFTPSNSTAIAYKYRKGGATAGTDSDGAVTAATSSGITIAADDDDKILTISVDPNTLTAGYPNLQVIADPGGSASAVEIAIIAVIWPKYGATSNISAIA